MKILPAIFSITRSLACLATFALTGTLQAQTLLIHDDFSGHVDGSKLYGNSAQTNVTGNTGSPGVWIVDEQGGTFPGTMIYDNGTGSGSINTGFGNGAYISLNSTSSYTKPGQFTISADFCMNTITDGTETFRGLGLGFYINGPYGVEPNTNFTGLVIKPGTGLLTFLDNGATQTQSAAFTGIFDANTFYNLSYSVNTSTGGIFDVLFNGVDVSASFAGITAFTDSATNLTGFYGSTSADVNFNGRVDNFSVAAVPEPSTYILLGLGSLALAIRRRKMNVGSSY